MLIGFPQEDAVLKSRYVGFRLLSQHVAMALLVTASAVPEGAAQERKVIDLTQTGCQFLEAENGVDHAFVTTKSADCEAINSRTGADRLAKAVALNLEPGDYIFRVTNKNVPYELGFWLRDHDYSLDNPLHKLTKTSVSGGGLTVGKTQDYDVTLKPGEYLYSCPLNPTPDYRLVVTSN